MSDDHKASGVVITTASIENKWPSLRIRLTFSRLNYNTVCAIFYIGFSNLSSNSQSSVFYFLSPLLFIIVSSSHFFSFPRFTIYFSSSCEMQVINYNGMTHPTTAPRNFSPKPPHPDIKSRAFVGSFLFVGKHPRMQGREVREISWQHPKQHKMMPRSGSMNPVPLALDTSSNTNYIHSD